MGLIGLGTGTLAVYGRPGDVYRFYEINPQVLDLARSEFSFMSESQARIETALGDARLSLEREPPRGSTCWRWTPSRAIRYQST